MAAGLVHSMPQWMMIFIIDDDVGNEMQDACNTSVWTSYYIVNFRSEFSTV